MSFCSKCGTEVPEDGTFCPMCGNTVSKAESNVQTNTEKVEDPNISPKSRTCALVLAIVLGPLGVQNFYLGNSGRAVSQLVSLIFGSIMMGVSTVILGRNIGAGIFLYLISTTGIVYPTVTSIVDIVNIAKGTAKDSSYRYVNRWGGSDVATTSSSSSSVASDNKPATINNQTKKPLVEKLFFLFPIVIGAIMMYTPARLNGGEIDEDQLIYFQMFVTRYINWNLILGFAIMAVGTFGFGFDFKKGIFMGLGASVGAFPLFKLGSFVYNGCLAFLSYNVTAGSYYRYKFEYFLDDVTEVFSRTLKNGEIWKEYFISVFVLFAVAIVMAFVAKAVRKYNKID